ncbi:MAG: hypothetical protein FWH29_01060 [Methanobrevibacter sp.]|nr:hypothetical protein [Methanobrevibacter sp.]
MDKKLIIVMLAIVVMMISVGIYYLSSINEFTMENETIEQVTEIKPDKTNLTKNSSNTSTKTTGEIFFGENTVNKPIGKGDFAGIYYSGNFDGQYEKNTMNIRLWSSSFDPQHHKLIEASVKFSKKVNGETYYTTKIFKPDENGEIIYSPENGYKPYSATITYKDI